MPYVGGRELARSKDTHERVAAVEGSGRQTWRGRVLRENHLRGIATQQVQNGGPPGQYEL